MSIKEGWYNHIKYNYIKSWQMDELWEWLEIQSNIVETKRSLK